MSDRAPLFAPSTILATWFYSGLFPWAPGTIGSLAALPFGLLAAWLYGWIGILIFAALVYLIGLWAVGRYMAITGRKDPGEVVIDEVAAQMLPLLVAPVELAPWLAAFVLFRIFDILKPFPCGYIDRKHHGGFGVMTDDLAAGAYATLGMLLLEALGAW